MKITVVNASSAGSITESVLRTVTETLAELGEEIVHIKLDKINIPFYTFPEKKPDEETLVIHDIIHEIINSDGTVFVAPSVLGGTCALMKSLLEHFQAPKFGHALLDKNCMVVSAAEGTYSNPRETIEGISRIIGILGGLDAVRCFVPIYKSEDVADITQFVEKQTEDYYRILRQSRKFFPLETFAYQMPQKPERTDDDAPVDEILAREIKERAQGQNLTEEQEQDISDIAQLVADRLENPAKPEKAITAPVKPRLKTCKQLTSSMPHYFNPQLAAGIRTIISINISGDESFASTIIIDGANCRHEESAAPDAEMQINADAKVWTDVLTGKVSAQKAFMIGQLKVRGNFLLLTKMDQLFTRMEL